MRPTGVLWVGPIYDHGGYGSVSRNYVRGLLGTGMPVRVVNTGFDHPDIDPWARSIVSDCETTDIGPAPVAVVHSTPDILGHIRLRGVAATVSMSLFETHSLPATWVAWCNSVDQVWVPSRFNARSYARAGVHRGSIRVLHYSVDTQYFHAGVSRSPIPGAVGFVFLYVFAFNWRKGFDLLLQAYGREFTATDDVTLILKVLGDPDGTDIERVVLESAAPDFDPSKPSSPRVVVRSESVPQHDLRALYAACDCYVSTDRANGWGMPCMEAMSMGKPAATIDWSGSTEFMRDDNAFLIKPFGGLEPVDLRLAEEFPGAIYRGQQWARVSVEAVRAVLRQAFSRPDLRRRKADRGAEHVRRHLSLEQVGWKVREALGTFRDLEPQRDKATVEIVKQRPPPDPPLRRSISFRRRS